MPTGRPPTNAFAPGNKMTALRKNSRGGLPRAERYASLFTLTEEQIAAGFPGLVSKAFELSNGVMVENDKGVVYKEQPDIRAIEFLMTWFMGKPDSQSQVAMSAAYQLAMQAETELRQAQGQQILAYLQAGLPAAQAAAQIAQARRLEAETETFKASIVKREDIEEAVNAVSRACIGYLQQVTREDMHDVYSANDDAWQGLLERIRDKILEAASGALGTEIDADYEPEDSEDSE